MRLLTTLMVSSILMLPPRIALAQAPPSLSPAAAALEARAQALYQEGREHFRAGRFDEARAAFLSSLERYDSPNTRMYLGRTLARLSRAAEAFSMLDRAARDAEERALSEPRYAATRDSARAEAEALRPSLAFLRVRVDPAPDDLTLSVNGGPPRRGAADVALPFAPGVVTVRAQAEGYEPAEARAALERGESQELRLSLRAAAVVVAADAGVRAVEVPVVTPVAYTRRGPVRSLGVAVGVTGVTALAAGLALSLVAWDQYQTVRDDSSQRDLALDGIRNRDTANVLFGVGGALGLTGLLMYLLAPRRLESPSGAALLLGPSGLGVSGRF